MSLELSQNNFSNTILHLKCQTVLSISNIALKKEDTIQNSWDIENQKITRPFPKTISEFDHRKCHFAIGFLKSSFIDQGFFIDFYNFKTKRISPNEAIRQMLRLDINAFSLSLLKSAKA